MNRIEFMTELERLLKEIPEEERKEAIQYYENYFADAGLENEQHIIAELESPKKVARTIKEGLRGKEEESSDTGKRDIRIQDLRRKKLRQTESTEKKANRKKTEVC